MSQGVIRPYPLDTDGTLAADSDRLVATQKATKTYVDSKIGLITDATLPFSDITTNNASTIKHGFAPKLSGVATEFLDGTGNYSTPDIEDAWYQWTDASLMANGSATTVAYACTRNESGTPTASGPDANQLACVNFASGATINTIVMSSSESSGAAAGGGWVVGREGQWIGYIRIVDTTNVRIFAGVSGLTTAAQNASDAPVGSYAMFRLSTSATDTNWQFVIGDGATVEVIDTTIPATTSTMIRMEIRWDGTATNSFTAYINGALVATGTKNPAAATSIRFATYLQNLVASNKQIKLAGQLMRTKWPT